ncbi:hypothetical protein ANA_C13546 [Anabaena sp. 90]|jgi:hypothetical protein|uniref:hypothetical protein n=1 Tax=Anabaena sp. 90 TaxID=46234 RepID=UPI00029B7742|nr:hypothetical protein [Anabaena sp. 90]AFW96208.1 hypothetical protein ANA_C13546 [Anabaena sp. 90]
MKISKIIVFVNVLAINSVLFPMTAQAETIDGATVLGGVDIDKYCQDRFGPGSESARAEETAWGWRCRIREDLVTISMDNVCRFQYNQGAKSHTKNERDPFSWVCLQK